MGQAGDVYSVVLDYGDAAVQERAQFFYELGVPAIAVSDALADEFQTKVLPFIANTVSSITQFTGLHVKNLFDLTDFNDTVINPPVLGGRGASAMPAMIALSFVSEKLSLLIRPARKRFGFIDKACVSGSTFIDAGGFFAIFDACATALGETLDPSISSPGQLIPVSVQRILYLTPQGNEAYRLPGFQAESNTIRAQNWAWQPRVATQNTRRIGRGI